MGICSSELPFASDLNKNLEEVLNYVQGDIKDQVDKLVNILVTFGNEHTRIVNEMKRTSPKSYENMLYSEYPDENLSDVNKLALKNVTSNAVKEKISNEIYKKVEPKIDEKLADQPSTIQDFVKKRIQKLIRESVDKAVDEGAKKIDLSKKPQESTE